MKKIRLYSLILIFALIIETFILPMTPAKAVMTDKPMKLKIGQSQKIVIDITKGTKIKTTFKSTNTSIATVSRKGTVKGIGGGKCTVKTKTKYKIGQKIHYVRCNVPIIIKGTPADNTQDTNTNSKNPSESTIYQKLMAQREKYPQGMSWTEKNKFTWKVLRKKKVINGIKYTIKIHLKCKACMAFAARMSNAAFGKKRTGKKIKNPNVNQIKTGDIIIIPSHNPDKPKEKHAAIVLSKDSNNFTVAEGNLKVTTVDSNGNVAASKGIINWGRQIPISEKIYYIYTRYK